MREHGENGENGENVQTSDIRVAQNRVQSRRKRAPSTRSARNQHLAHFARSLELLGILYKYSVLTEKPAHAPTEASYFDFEDLCCAPACEPSSNGAFHHSHQAVFDVAASLGPLFCGEGTSGKTTKRSQKGQHCDGTAITGLITPRAPRPFSRCHTTLGFAAGSHEELRHCLRPSRNGSLSSWSSCTEYVVFCASYERTPYTVKLLVAHRQMHGSVYQSRGFRSGASVMEDNLLDVGQPSTAAFCPTAYL